MLYNMYVIKQYTLDQAKKYNYTVKPSTNLNKKVDVHEDHIKPSFKRTNKFKNGV